MSTKTINRKKQTKTNDKGLSKGRVAGRLIVCPRCGGESDEPIRRGKNDTIYKCFDCNKDFIASPPSKVHHLKKCPVCNTFNNKVIEEHEARDPLLNNHICSKCEEEIAEFSEVVKAGGVYWKCNDCNNYGVILPNDFAKKVREEHGIFAPDPTGVIFTKKNCPVCRDNIRWHGKPATA